MRNFKKIIDLAKVIDLRMMRMSFTWCYNRVADSWARLDRFLYDPMLLSWFPNLVQKGLSRSLSDHNPVSIGEQVVDWCPKPFPFLNSWLEDKDLLVGVSKSWKQSGGGGSSRKRLFFKMKAVKDHMKKWLKHRKNVGDNLKILETELVTIEEKAVVQGWTLALREERSSCLAKLWKQIRLDEQKWKQISKVKWLKEGDRNSRYFHTLSNLRKKINFIGELSIGGRVCCAPAQVKEGVHSFFKEHFKRRNIHRPQMPWLV
ncbi:hypothetical protein Ddye_001637 [Dipteronia dyeriana]|uniref:Reverse transcriptase n=1 Tax=Dipteronia dyeriana TaxID=168575 RepID=A0AAD9XPJ8_9ROSI|nr:hypothetical protein Ddye_001637 [Dipteronia dyeriana]